jgi:hypothetical protein
MREKILEWFYKSNKTVTQACNETGQKNYYAGKKTQMLEFEVSTDWWKTATVWPLTVLPGLFNAAQTDADLRSEDTKHDNV